MSLRKVVLIIQARMGSKRLPGKTMMSLAGKPLLERIINRAKRCKKVDEIVLATTTKSEDDVLVEVATRSGIQTFRGSEEDLVDRYYQAALQSKADFVVRLPADNPVVEPTEVDRIIEHHLNSDDDFSSNLGEILNNGYPDGLGAEVFSINKLQEVWQTATDQHNREHLHTFFYEHPERFKIGTVQCPGEFSRPDLVLDVNTKEQYDYMNELYSYCISKGEDFTIHDIVQWHDRVYTNGKRR